MTGTTPQEGPHFQNHRMLCPSRGGWAGAVLFSMGQSLPPPVPCPVPCPCPCPRPPSLVPLTGSFTKSCRPSPCRRPCRYVVASRCCCQLFSRPCRGEDTGWTAQRAAAARGGLSPGLGSGPCSPLVPLGLGPRLCPRDCLGAEGGSLGPGEGRGQPAVGALGQVRGAPCRRWGAGRGGFMGHMLPPVCPPL